MYWHDGAPFGALDVHTIKAIQDPKFQGAPELAEAWKGITVEPIDDYNVRFKLRNSFSPPDKPVSWHAAEYILKDVPPVPARNNRCRSSPVGTGPY